MKKGFTLVELLAVIIILGVLSVLIVPKVINTLNDSEQKTNMASAEGLLKAAEYRYQDNEIKGISENIIIDYTNNQNTNELEYSGKKPEKGHVTILKNGKIAMSVKIGDNCYSKNYNGYDITATIYNQETCGKSTSIVTSGDGLYESTTEPGRLIYRGENPNNYIMLKENGVDTLYRIISYETDGTIKVVRSEKLDTDMPWDLGNSRTGSNNTYCTNAEFGCNVWGNQNNTLFNQQALNDNFHYSYYTSTSTTNLTDGRAGKVADISSLNTYLNTSWLANVNLSNYIDNHKFNVGSIYYVSTYESGDKGIENEKAEEKLYTWTGKVALQNITEFVEASTNPECNSVYSNFYYNYPKYYYQGEGETGKTEHPLADKNYPCKISNWTFKNYGQWTLTIYPTSTTGIWLVSEDNFFVGYGAYHDVGIRPAFYLKSSTKLGGIGTESEPYYLID